MRETKVLFGAGQTGDGRSISVLDELSLLVTLREAVAEKYGGYTLYAHEGGWRNAAGAVVYEPGHTLSVLGIETEREAYALASFVRALFSQASVVLVLGSGEAVFVE